MDTPANATDGLSSSWSLALGLLLIITGGLALVFPVLAAVSAALYVGWFALFAGVVAIVAAVRTRSESHFGWRLVLGLVYAALGVVLLVNPIAGAAALALVVGALMLATGVVDLVLAFRVKPNAGWGWLLANGVLSVVIAIMIAVGWPLESLVLIGYLVGFQIIACGVTRVVLAAAARKAPPPAAA